MVADNVIQSISFPSSFTTPSHFLSIVTISTMADTSTSTSNNAQGHPLSVAIIGGGIIGVITAIGLRRRNIPFRIYERSQTWSEISAGFSFTAAAREWMAQIDPALVELLSSISQKTDDTTTNNAYWDGFHPRTREEGEDEDSALMFRTSTKNLSFWGCVRAQFLAGMAGMLPSDAVVFGKRLVRYEDAKGNRVTLFFDDGSTAEADVLLGCDGIHSTTRKVMLGAEHPAAGAGFSHTVAYRTMVPIDVGVAALGKRVTQRPCNFLGPNADLLVYPVMSGTLLNMALFAYDPAEFPDPDRMTVPASRTEIEVLLKDWSPQLSGIWTLYPEKVVKWGIFDLEENPPPTYASGRVCLIGDAAHASTPYLGVGACTGVEDALVVCTVLESVREKTGGGDDARQVLGEALQRYSRARIERGRWIHHHSRQMGQLYHWRYGPTGRDPARMKKKLEENWAEVVKYDVLAPLRSEVQKLGDAI
ncbi:hypothetical protein BJX70DRAFT_355896 [Aspergillus crustosus]